MNSKVKARAQAKPKNNYEDDEDANLDYANFDDVNDKEYERMLPKQGAKLKTLEYFRNSAKYAGRVSHQKEVEEEIEDVGLDEEEEGEEEEVNEADGIKQALTDIKNRRKQRSNLLSEDLKAIDEEDRENLIRMKEQQQQQGSPEALQNQLHQLNKLTQIRYYSQKNLQSLKKYPTHNYPSSPQLHSLHKQAEQASLTTLEKLVQNFEHLAINYFKVENKFSGYGEIARGAAERADKRLNVERLWEIFEEETKDINERMEQEIINWSQRTTLLRNSAGKSQFNSLLMQTPVGQAKKVIEDWQKVSKKCQQKRSPFRILFEPQQNLLQTTDKSIYDDLDLLQQVQRNYEQDLEKDDKDFLIKDTLKYLQNKSKTKISKDVDRKASKNRKIRFNVHPKLLNFMPCQNDNLLEARDEIVKNLFNKGTQEDEGVDYIDI